MSTPGLKAPSSLGRRLLRMAVVFGLGMALFASAVQAWWSYRAGLAAIRQTMDQIGQTHAKGVAKALWDFSSDQLSLQLEGMLNFPYLSYVAVRGEDGFTAEAGLPRPGDVFQREFPLSRIVSDRQKNLGVLILQADTSKVFATVLRQVLMAFVFQSAMVALVVVFFLVLFKRQVTGNLEAIAGYLRTFRMEDQTVLALDKRRRGDEFDVLTDTFNAMRRKIQSMYRDVLAAQQAARAGEERLNLALEASGASVWDMDYEARLVRLNSRSGGMFGFHPFGFPVSIREWMMRIHPEDAPGVRLSYKSLQGHGNDSFQADFRYRATEGVYRWTHARGRVTARSPKGRPLRMVGIMMDLTERILIQQTLEEKERFASAIIEGLPGLFVMLDARLRLARWNRNFADRVAGGETALAGEDIFRFIDPRDRGRLALAAHKTVAPDKTSVEEIRVMTAGPQATPHYVFLRRFEAGGLPFLLCNAQDVSVLKDAEDSLRKTTNVLNSILEAMPSAVIGLDGGGRVTHWNTAAAFMSGSPEAWSLGRPLSQACPWLDRLLCGPDGPVGSGKAAILERMPMPQGEETRMVDVQVSPIGLQGAEGAVVRLDDVTSRVQMEEMMVQSEKMISVGGLAAGIAHEINNPLGVILQSAQNAERRLSPDLDRNRREARSIGLEMDVLQDYLRRRGIRDILGEIKTAGERAADIIRSMLRFSRSSESKQAPCDLAAIVDSMIELVARDFDLKKHCDPRKVRFVREYDPDLGVVSCTETQIGQVVFNILKNAVQAVAEKRDPDFDPVITARLKRENGQVRMELEDNGPGLAPVLRKRIFEPFFTTKPPGEGTGLGMSVSYYIVTNNHKGRIFVESEPGRGAKFVVLLPAAAHVPDDRGKP